MVGTEGGREFTRVLIGNELTMDVAAAEQDILDAGDALIRKHSGIGAILLECTNMVPYARALRDRLGIPVTASCSGSIQGWRRAISAIPDQPRARGASGRATSFGTCRQDVLPVIGSKSALRGRGSRRSGRTAAWCSSCDTTDHRKPCALPREVIMPLVGPRLARLP